MKNWPLCLTICLFVSSSLFAQDNPRREIGLRTNGFSDLGLIYKKQIRENTYRRYRLAFGNVGVSVIDGSALVSFSAGGAVGIEKRRPLSEKLQFIYGTELIASLNVTHSDLGTLTLDPGTGTTINYRGNNLTLVTPSVGIGFVLGAQYNFNSRWYASAELIPSITVSGTFGGGTSIYGIQAGFNSTSVGLTGAYRF